MMPPDYFPYFIALFILNIIHATHLLFTYNRTWLIQLNALAFILLAIRCCTEYYLPSTDSYQTASTIAAWHSIIIYIQFGVMYICVWWYIRPFQNFKKEKYFNTVFFAFVVLTRIIYLPILYNRILYKFAPEKIDGYWQYYTDSTTLWFYYYIIIQLSLTLIMILTFLKGIFDDKKSRFSKALLLVLYIIMVLITNIVSLNTSNEELKYALPNSVIFHMIFTLLATWFLTNYRLFQDSSLEVIGDTFNSVSEIAIFTRPDFTIWQSNKLAQSIFQIGDEPIHFFNLLSDNSRALSSEVDVFIQKLLSSPKQEQELKLVIDDKECLFLISAAKYIKAGRLFGYTFFLKDVTEKRRRAGLLALQNEELKSLNNVKDRIFAIIGHDLRKPAIAFRGITKKVNFLLRKKDYKTLNELGLTIEQEAFALNKLTDNLLNWALTQKNVMPYNPRAVQVEDTVKEVLTIFKNPATEKKIKLSCNVPVNMQVYVDINAFSTIIRNLVDNAIKYTEEGGDVSIFATAAEKNIRIQVTDTGMGIPEHKMNAIFSLTQGKSEDGTAGEKGTGLGLHLIYELVKINKGQIEVVSEVGKGTSFGLILPPAGLRLIA